LKYFGYLLVLGWAGLFGTVALSFIFPAYMSHILGPIADFFVLIPVSLLFSTAAFGVIHLYRTGLRRSKL
jgi:hypothetical protein